MKVRKNILRQSLYPDLHQKTNRVYSGLSLSFVENPFSSSCGILLTPTNKHEWTQDLLFTEVKKKKKNPKNNVNKLYLLNRLGANLVG